MSTAGRASGSRSSSRGTLHNRSPRLAQRGLRCPEDLAVVGFDDFPWASAFHPRLTTVAQPGYELGHTAADLLLQRIANRHIGPPVKKVLSTTLMIRESCGSTIT